MIEYGFKDSGTRQEFETGSVRDTREGKGRYDLITPFGLAEVAVIYEKGAEKYAERNWEKGQPLSRFLDSAKRHVDQVLMGKTDENHAAHAAWNLLGFIHVRKMIEMGVLPAELNDLPNYKPPVTLEEVQKTARIMMARANHGDTPSCSCGDPGDCANCSKTYNGAV